MILFMKGFAVCLFGSFCVYIGALQMAGSVLPTDYAYKVGELHGKWLREKVLGLQPIRSEEQE